MRLGIKETKLVRVRRTGSFSQATFLVEKAMKRRHVLQTAAGAALLSLVQGQVMAADKKAAAPATDAEVILKRLLEKDVPQAVGFDARMRTLISIASLTALGDARVLAQVVDSGLAAGVKPLEMREAMVQAMAYSGLPSTIRAQDVPRRRFEASGQDLPDRELHDGDRREPLCRRPQGAEGHLRRSDRRHAQERPRRRTRAYGLIFSPATASATRTPARDCP